MGDIFNDENMKTFIGKCARLAWKMILQRPQMRFDVSGWCLLIVYIYIPIDVCVSFVMLNSHAYYMCKEQ